MAVAPPTKEDRDANLDALQSAVDEWSDKEKERLENEVKYLRTVLEGRGQEDAVTTNLDKASTLLEREVIDYINFGSEEAV